MKEFDDYTAAKKVLTDAQAAFAAATTALQTAVAADSKASLAPVAPAN